MVAQPESYPRMTEAEYLAFERESELKHEFVDGEIYAMSGASPNHNLIVANTIAALHSQLRSGSCRVYASDTKIQTPATRSYVYPDISIFCDKLRVDDDERDILLNPTLIVEVLSPSTEGYDRGMKFQRYREIESLREYVLIAQDAPHIEHFVHQADDMWQFNDVNGLEAMLPLPSINGTLALAEVYERVDFAGDAV